MAKKSSKQQATLQKEENFVTRHPVITVLVLSFVLLLILFYKVMLGGYSFQPPDQMTSNAYIPYVEQSFEHGDYPFWTPYIFSGMPSYASLSRIPLVNIIDYNTRKILHWLHPIIPNPHFAFTFLNFFLLALLIYALQRNQRLSPFIAIISAIAVISLPQFVAFVSFGHNTKLATIALIPLILLLVKKLVYQRNLLYFGLLALVMGQQLMRSHVQVTYYTLLLIGLYLLWELIYHRKNPEFKRYLAGTGMVLVALAISILLTAVLYLPVWEYQHYSIRGGAEGGGLEYNYASSWSFHPIESLTFVIPSFMGFGGQTYWGQMPFTDYPLYFGVIVFFLAGLAFLLRRNRQTWFYGIVAIFSLIVSFGNHIPILYKPMYNFLPFFDKFRIPSMIHILLDLAMIILAGFGLQAILDFKHLSQKERDAKFNKVKRYFWFWAGIIGFLTLLLLVGKSVYLELVASSRSNLTFALRQQAYQLAMGDAFKSLAFILVSGFVILQYLQQKLSATVMSGILAVLIIIDLWVIDLKIMNPQPATQEEAHFAATPAVTQMKQDDDVFRILPVLDREGSNWYMYHLIQSITGYSPAKLKIYQEFMEESGYTQRLNAFIAKYWRLAMQNNQQRWVPVPLEEIPQGRKNFDYAMLDMLNVKYLVVNHLPINDPRYRLIMNQQQMLYENTTVLPRAFFSNSIQVLTGRRQIFDRMKDGLFDPRETAIIEEPPPFNVQAADSNSVQLASFENHEMKFNATVKSPTVMVVSEVYYPAGWKAYVNGQETKIYKTNYFLRSIFLQPGEHEIVFTYDSSTFRTGMWISISTLILLLAMVAVGYWKRKPTSTD
ncbi:YfhO family protein [candidate division KSB1 bacterium]|nr:YfhO family protein [candidate division KSB1 bacterium]